MTDKPDWMKVCSGINCDSCKSRKNKGKGDCLDFNIDKYPLITKYMGWEIHTSLDANDMVAAMNEMVEKGDWEYFFYYCSQVCDRMLKPYQFYAWLMRPTRFFELMGKWLKEKESEKSER